MDFSPSSDAFFVTLQHRFPRDMRIMILQLFQSYGYCISEEKAYNDNELVEMKRVVFLIVLLVLVVVLASSSASPVSDTSASLADSSIPDNEITTNQTEASDSSASTSITITMTGVLDE
jgi:hypothetical protein